MPYHIIAKLLLDTLSNESISDFKKVKKLIKHLDHPLILNNKYLNDAIIQCIASYIPKSEEQSKAVEELIKKQSNKQQRVWWKLWLGKVYNFSLTTRAQLDLLEVVIQQNYKLYVSMISKDGQQVDEVETDSSDKSSNPGVDKWAQQTKYL